MGKINNRRKKPKKSRARVESFLHLWSPAGRTYRVKTETLVFTLANKNNDSHYTHAMRPRERAAWVTKADLGTLSHAAELRSAKQNQPTVSHLLQLAATSADEKIDPVKSWSGRGACLPACRLATPWLVFLVIYLWWFAHLRPQFLLSCKKLVLRLFGNGCLPKIKTRLEKVPLADKAMLVIIELSYDQVFF